MQESMYKFMKVGLIHFMAYPQVMRGEGPILETPMVDLSHLPLKLVG